jgi:hypothetical protein
MMFEDEDTEDARFCECDEYAYSDNPDPAGGPSLCANCGLLRPTYINCVLVDSAKQLSACGRKIPFYEWSFTNWEHADLNEAQEGLHITCAKCKLMKVDKDLN